MSTGCNWKCWRNRDKDKLVCTYWFADKKAWEKIPYAVESWRDNGGHVVIWDQTDWNHAEVKQCEVYEEQVPEELLVRPVKADHGVDN